MFALVALLGLASTSGFSFGSRSVGVNVNGDVTALKMVREILIISYFYGGGHHHEVVVVTLSRISCF